jgi:Ran GTPase-activating protein (RanGAP) involved in mRNA processing and transport
MLSALLGFFFDGGRENSSSSPPLHPFQRFRQLCVRIQNDDPELQTVALRDETIHIPSLSRALAVNTHLQTLELVQVLTTPNNDDEVVGAASSHSNDYFSILCRKGLFNNKGLVRLNLSDNPCLQSTQAQTLQEALQDHPTLKVLLLSRCQLGDVGVQALAVSRLGRCLHELDLSQNQLTDGAAVAQIVTQNKSLQRLNVSENTLGDGGCSSMMRIMATTNMYGSSLQSLNLASNCIGVDGAQAIGEAFVHLTLIDLRLCRNPFGNAGIALLAMGLASNNNTTLQKLSLKQCSIGTEGAIHLAHAITQNNASALKDLLLGCNQLIGNAGAVALVAAASSNLQRLSLCRSGIQGGGDLVDILETGTNGTLQALLLFHNNISSRDKAALQFWTRLNATGGRRLLLGEEEEDNHYGDFLWIHVLEKASDCPPVLYYLLRQKPELCCYTSVQLTN